MIMILSFGVFGGIVLMLVINYLEVGIVGVNWIVEWLMICDGVIVVCKMMNLLLLFDYCVVDGVDVVEFI